jgi:hypothetical protein
MQVATSAADDKEVPMKHVIDANTTNPAKKAKKQISVNARNTSVSTTTVAKKKSKSKSNHHGDDAAAVGTTTTTTNTATTTTITTILLPPPPPAIFLNAYIPSDDSELERLSIDIVQDQIRQIAESYLGTTLHHETITVHVVTINNPALNQSGLDDLCRNATTTTNNKKKGNNNYTTNIRCIHVKHFPHKHSMGQGGELDTLGVLYDYCKNNTASTTSVEATDDVQHPTKQATASARVIYLHNKGSFHPGEYNTKWRRAMTDAVTRKECLEPPPPAANGIIQTSSQQAQEQQERDDSCNICGLQFQAPPKMFTLLMSGNFFAASCDYVNQLLHPREFSRDMKLTILPEAMKRKKSGSFHFAGPEQTKAWAMGQKRYNAEHWIGSHPSLQPCDMAAIPVGYWY